MSSCNLKLCGSYRQSYIHHTNTSSPNLCMYSGPLYIHFNFSKGQSNNIMPSSIVRIPIHLHVHACNNKSRKETECQVCMQAYGGTPSREVSPSAHYIYHTQSPSHRLFSQNHATVNNAEMSPRCAVRTRIRISRHFLLP